MSQDTNVQNLIINKLTKQQYESISNPDPTQLYFITDEVISSSDVTTALGYTPYNGTTNPNGYISSASVATLTDVALSSVADGQLLAYDSATSKWKNVSAPASAVWGNITGTLANQTDLSTALNGKQETLVSGTNIKTVNSTSLLGSGNIAVQPTLVSGTNIKTVNSTSLLGSGDIAVQETLVSGTNIKTINGNSILGSGDLSVGGSVDIDEETITLNSSDELQTVAVLDDNDKTNGIKTWTGTRAQYDAITTKDPYTLYNIIDDIDSFETFPSRVIGQIIQSSIPITDSGLHLLDGSLIQGNGIYADFVSYIGTLSSNYPTLFVTEANWQASVTQYGVCGKFVYDSVNNTVRLPKYSNKIYTGGGMAPVVGNGMTLGLTNGTQAMGLSYSGNASYGLWGAIDSYGSTIGSTPSGDPSTSKTVGITTDPTKSGIIAQLSDITTSLDGYYYIVVATSARTDIIVDIDEIATDLNGKADVDLTNCTKPHIVETYGNGTSWYRVYSDGWCEQGGIASLTTTAGVTVSLLKQFVNTDYVISTNIQTTEGTGYGANIAQSSSISYPNKATSSFGIYTAGINNFNVNGVCWEAKGYIS